MSKSNGKNNSNSNTKNFLISKIKPSRFSAAATVMPSQTLYVSLDNADTVIEGAPLLALFARGGHTQREAGGDVLRRKLMSSKLLKNHRSRRQEVFRSIVF
jgi:hypothetical protein